jgi:hypothetical protein
LTRRLGSLKRSLADTTWKTGLVTKSNRFRMR